MLCWWAASKDVFCFEHPVVQTPVWYRRISELTWYMCCRSLGNYLHYVSLYRSWNCALGVQQIAPITVCLSNNASWEAVPFLPISSQWLVT